MSTLATRETYDLKVNALCKDAESFMTRAEHNISSENAENVGTNVQAWLATPDADVQLSAWMSDVVQYLNAEMIGNGPIGHDRRHIAKDLASGFRQANEDGFIGLDLLSVIPSFLHDTGRLVEATFAGVVPPEVTSRDHALFSFGIAYQFCNQSYFSRIPREVQDHILYAILDHSKRTVLTPMAHITQTSDREQLIGPEGVARLLAVQVGTHDMPIVITQSTDRAIIPRDALGTDLDGLHAIEAYIRNLYPQYSEKSERRADQLKAISAAFLLLAAPDAVREQIFAPEYQRDITAVPDLAPVKKLVALEVWRAAKVEVTAAKPQPANAQQVMDFVFNASGNSVPGTEMQKFAAHFGSLPQDSQIRLTTAVAYIEEKRKELDRDDIELLNKGKRPKFSAIIACWASDCIAG